MGREEVATEKSKERGRGSEEKEEGERGREVIRQKVHVEDYG